MDAEGYDAAVEAADRRIAQLMLDLGRLVDKQESQSGSAGAGHTAERVKRESDSAVRRGYSSAAKEWEELFGAGGDTDEEGALVVTSSDAHSQDHDVDVRHRASLSRPPGGTPRWRHDTGQLLMRATHRMSSSTRVSPFLVLRRAIETILADSSPRRSTAHW